MKKKLNMALIAIVVVILVLGGVLFLNNQKAPRELDLAIDNFKLDEEYVYNGIPWGTALEEVKKQLQVSIEKLDVPGTVGDASLVDYRTDTQFILDGKHTSSTTFKFQGNKFVMASYVFTLDKYDEKWYNAQLEKLVEFYGEESNIAENVAENFTAKTHRWDTEMTSLQWGNVVKSDGSAVVTLAVFYLY